MKKSNKPRIIVILGPTASGKTALAIEVARKWNGEIVSADSRQIYRGMDIGTAKPPKKELALARHYLIDIKNPNEDYSLAQYKKDALSAIHKILASGKLPIITGGTALYIKAVTDNLYIPEVKPNRALREKLESRIKKEGLQKLFDELVKLDPEAQYIVDARNPRRVIRALEVAIGTGRPFSAQRKKGAPIFEFLKIGILLPKEKLRRRIDTRVDQMRQDGLIKEVKGLVKKYGAPARRSLGEGGGLPAFDAIGYIEIIEYLNKKISLREATEKIKKKTWKFARRQMTWWRRDKDINWVKNKSEALKLTRRFLG